MSRAPCTLPRRRAGRKRTSGWASWIADCRADDGIGRLGQVGSAQHDGDRSGGEQRGGRRDGLGADAAHLLRGRAGQEGLHDLGGGARAVHEGGGGEVGEAAALGAELDDGGAVAHHRVAQAEEEDRQLLLEVGGEEEHRAARRADVVDGRPRQAEDDLRRQPVAELGVDVVGADDALGQLGPRVGALVGEPAATDHRHPVGVGGARARRWPGSARPTTRPRPARRPCGPAGRAGGRRCSRRRSRTDPCRRANPS